MTSATPVRKPYRKAPPQHREMRHVLPVAAPTPAPQHDTKQVNHNSLDITPPPLQHFSTTAKQPQSARSWCGRLTLLPPPSDSELDNSSLSSLELCFPSSQVFSSQSSHTRTTNSQCPAAIRKPSDSCCLREEHRGQIRTTAAHVPKSILKQPALMGVEHIHDDIRKSKSVELLHDSRVPNSFGHETPTRSVDHSDRCMWSRRSSDLPSLCGTSWIQKMQVLEEKVRFSNFLDEITCQVMSPAHLALFGRTLPARGKGSLTLLQCRPTCREWQSETAGRTHRWDSWVAAIQRRGRLYLQEEEAGHLKTDITEGFPPKGVKIDIKKKHKHALGVPNRSLLSHFKVGHEALFGSVVAALIPPCVLYIGVDVKQNIH